MIVNVGCGDDLMEGAVNVDCRAVGDVVADCRALPFDTGSVSHLHAYDVLEHLPADQTQVVLAEWARVLAPGAALTLRVPNMHALAVQISYWADKPGPQLTAFIQNVYGAHRWSEDGDVDVHHTAWTPATLNVALQEAGFDVASNDLDLNMTVQAVRR